MFFAWIAQRFRRGTATGEDVVRAIAIRAMADGGPGLMGHEARAAQPCQEYRKSIESALTLKCNTDGSVAMVADGSGKTTTRPRCRTGRAASPDDPVSGNTLAGGVSAYYAPAASDRALTSTDWKFGGGCSRAKARHGKVGACGAWGTPTTSMATWRRLAFRIKHGRSSHALDETAGLDGAMRALRLFFSTFICMGSLNMMGDKVDGFHVFKRYISNDFRKGAGAR